MATFMFSCNSNPKSEDSDQAETLSPGTEWVEVVLNVEGMTCEGCENAVKAGIESLDGIAVVESSFEGAWTKVKYDEQATSVDEITEKITETGYVVKGEKEEAL